MKQTIVFKLNEKSIKLFVDPERALLWVLRTDCGLTGAKYGCGEGFCGACTVLVNRKAVRSCQLSIKDVDGKEVITIEGLSRNGNLHPIQKAFIEHDAMQCGYCTPGMILNAYSLLLEDSSVNQKKITEYMEDNLCRCGAHTRIVQAIQTAAKEMKGGR
jgi:aerobic-type carbon monoxide dehydrogenase small subunit (CoxS/CutS family)